MSYPGEIVADSMPKTLGYHARPSLAKEVEKVTMLTNIKQAGGLENYLVNQYSSGWDAKINNKANELAKLRKEGKLSIQAIDDIQRAGSALRYVYQNMKRKEDLDTYIKREEAELLKKYGKEIYMYD